jgi:hypothetical protein
LDDQRCKLILNIFKKKYTYYIITTPNLHFNSIPIASMVKEL